MVLAGLSQALEPAHWDLLSSQPAPSLLLSVAAMRTAVEALIMMPDKYVSSRRLKGQGCVIPTNLASPSMLVTQKEV